jgi:hypothetical protein
MKMKKKKMMMMVMMSMMMMMRDVPPPLPPCNKLSFNHSMHAPPPPLLRVSQLALHYTFSLRFVERSLVRSTFPLPIENHQPGDGSMCAGSGCRITRPMT